MEDIKFLITKKLQLITFFLFTTGLFLGGKYSIYSLAIIVLHIIYDIIKNKKQITLNYSLVIIIVFYIWHLIGYFYSNNKDVAMFDYEVKFSILLIPLLLLFQKTKYNFINYFTLKNIYIISSTLFAIFFLIRLIYKYILYGSFINYYNFSIFLHPTYYAIYIDLAIIFAISLFAKASNRILKLLYALSIIIFLINIYFADSKASFIATLLILAYILIYYSFKYSKLFTIIGLSAFILLSVFVLQNSGRFKSAITVTFNYNEVLKNHETINESTGIRILAWNASLDIIKDNYIFGVGTGDIKDKLLDKYDELNYNYLLNNRLNVHNQFLETWLGQGIIGLAILLLIFIIPFIAAIKYKNIILQGFLILIFINFLFESMLNTQAGIIFFAFFYAVLVIDVKNNEQAN